MPTLETKTESFRIDLGMERIVMRSTNVIIRNPTAAAPIRISEILRASAWDAAYPSSAYRPTSDDRVFRLLTRASKDSPTKASISSSGGIPAAR